MTVRRFSNPDNHPEKNLSPHTRAALAVLRQKPRNVSELFGAGFSNLPRIDQELRAELGLQLVVVLRNAEGRP
jgi:hypothetical protein